jgi:hypothetical protein
MTRAALAEERRNEIDEWWEGGFLGAFRWPRPMRTASDSPFTRTADALREEFVWFIDARPQLTCELGGD